MHDIAIGRFLTLHALCTCTNTYRQYAATINPFPENPDESIPALRTLCEQVIDPIIDHYGIARFHLTFGFCSPDLTRRLAKKDPTTGKKNGMSTPNGDQHAAHEKSRRGRYICERLGASCDFRILNEPSDRLVDQVLALKLPFDSLYFYGPDRPIHISHGPQNKRDIRAFSPSGVPTTRGVEHWRALTRERRL